MRAICFANIREELARGRRIDQVLAREAAGDPAHPDGKLGDLDERDEPIEDRRGIYLMHSGINCFPGEIARWASQSKVCSAKTAGLRPNVSRARLALNARSMLTYAWCSPKVALIF